jgi:hypothetical protein
VALTAFLQVLAQPGKSANLSLPLVTSVLLLLFPVPAMITVHQESGWWFRGKAPGQIRALKQASAETEACSFFHDSFAPDFKKALRTAEFPAYIFPSSAEGP